MQTIPTTVASMNNPASIFNLLKFCLGQSIERKRDCQGNKCLLTYTPAKIGFNLSRVKALGLARVKINPG